MFRYINIESYRGLSHVVLEELNRVNIIVGDNNSGKTSIWEAIQFNKQFWESQLPGS